MTYEWSLCALVKDCNGLPITPELQYSLLIKLGSKFSSPLPASLDHTSPSLLFNKPLQLEFTTSSTQLPANTMQLLVVAAETILSPRGINTKKEQILAIATLPIALPLPASFTNINRHKFDKPTDSRANIRVSFTLDRTQTSPRSQRTRSPSPSPSSPSPSSVRSHKKSSSESDSPKKSIRHEQWQQLLKERNELYKMSESLYEQLRKCMGERDEYLRELRERELSEEQIREEMEFLKLKLQEEHEGHGEPSQHHDQQPSPQLLEEIYQLRHQNEQMRRLLAERQCDLKEFERRVKESLIAVDQFRREAVQARTDLIHKQSQLSISKHTHLQPLDPYQCIQELYRQLENRKYEQPFQLHQEGYELQDLGRQVGERVRREVARLVGGVMGRMRTQEDREWLLRAKVGLERKMDEILNLC